MIRINKSCIESTIRMINDKLPITKEGKRQTIEGNYAAHWGGWEIYYCIDGKRERSITGSFRSSHRETYRLLEGMDFVLTYKKSIYSAENAD